MKHFLKQTALWMACMVTFVLTSCDSDKNTDENPEWATKYGVQGIPTMLLISGGKIVHRQVGALPEPMLRDLVDQFLDVVKTQTKA